VTASCSFYKRQVLRKSLVILLIRKLTGRDSEPVPRLVEWGGVRKEGLGEGGDSALIMFTTYSAILHTFGPERNDNIYMPF
jgi:hypothetical protein